MYLGQTTDYIDCIYKQCHNGNAEAYYLYDDRLVKVISFSQELTETSESLFQTNKPQGDPYVIRTQDDSLYFLGTTERSNLVPDAEDIVLAEIDGMWKCDLVKSLKQAD